MTQTTKICLFRFAILGHLLALFAGCQGEMTQSPGNVQVTLALEDSRLELLSSVDVGELPNPPASSDAVRFRFVPSDGSAPVEGMVEDPRILRSEFDRAGQPDPRRLISKAGLVDVRIPATPGMLELSTTDGEGLGVLDFNPDAPRTQQMNLMRDADILGSPVKVLDQGDSANKVDVLFLPEGYTESELHEFHTHVDTIISQMKEYSGFRDQWSGFNFWRQDVRSETAGTGTNGIRGNTAFETASGVSGVERCVFFTTPAGIAAAKRLQEQAQADVTVVLVNTTSYGGCAGAGIVVTARPRNVADVVSHELGHALFGLADEYETTRPGGHCSAGPNVAISHRHEALPWADMLTTDELPTPSSASFGTVGAFEGAGYCPRGRFRPSHNCMMRNLGVGLCPVCRREVERTMQVLASSSSPGGIAVTNSTGAGIWVKCDGRARPTCTDWTFVNDGVVANIRTPDGRLVLHNAQVEAPVTFDQVRVTAQTESVTIYANVANPFSPDSSGGSSPSDDEWTVPEGLSPADNKVLNAAAVELTWNESATTDVFRVVLEIENNATWEVFHDLETMTPSLELALSETSARYRWRVTACDAANVCLTSPHAFFSTTIESTEPDTDTPADPNIELPSVVSQMMPAHESHVATDSATLAWSHDGTAASFNLTLRVLDTETNQWLESGDYMSIDAPEFQVLLRVPNTWYAWSVQACNAAGCSEWSEYSLLFRD